MKVIKNLLILLILMLCTLKAKAQSIENSHPIDMEIDNCIKKKSGTLDIIQCEFEGYKKWTEEMEKIYSSLIKKLDNDSKKLLQEQQISWAKTRDLTFEFHEKFYATKGVKWASMMASSKTDLVRKRAIELQTYLNVVDEK